MSALWSAVRWGLFSLCGFAAFYSLYGVLKTLFIGGQRVPPLLFLPALYGGDPYRSTLGLEAHALDTFLFGGIVLIVLMLRKRRSGNRRA